MAIGRQGVGAGNGRQAWHGITSLTSWVVDVVMWGGGSSSSSSSLLLLPHGCCRLHVGLMQVVHHRGAVRLAGGKAAATLPSMTAACGATHALARGKSSASLCACVVGPHDAVQHACYLAGSRGHGGSMAC
jgi:hypothetical protein